MCDYPVGYLTGKYAPNYPVPAPIQTVTIMSERVRIEDDVNEIHRDFYPYTFYSIKRMWYKETSLGIVTINHVKSQDGFSYVSTIGATPKQADYAIGWQEPNYPVPVVYDVLPDAEYLVMLYERALLTQQLRELKGTTIN
jgi:hypothetical protein